MYDEGVIIGQVVGIEGAANDRSPDLLLIGDSSRPKYPQTVACEFFGKTKELIRQLGRRDLVKIVGSIRSSQSKDGRWFTHFSAFSVTPLSHLIPSLTAADDEPEPPRQQQQRPAPGQHREVGADDDIF